MEKIGIIGGDQRQIYVKQFLEEHGWADRNSIFPDGYQTGGKQQSGFGRFLRTAGLWCFRCLYLRKGKLNTGAEYKPDAEQLMEYVKHGQCIIGGCFSKELKNRILCAAVRAMT